MRADRLDEHAAVLDDGLAVRSAAVVDEARLVAVDAGVDDGALAGDEQERMAVVIALALVAPVGLGVRDALAQVLDDARALADAPRRVHAAAVDARIARLDRRRLEPLGLALRCSSARTSALAALLLATFASWAWDD